MGTNACRFHHQPKTPDEAECHGQSQSWRVSVSTPKTFKQKHPPGQLDDNVGHIKWMGPGPLKVPPGGSALAAYFKNWSGHDQYKDRTKIVKEGKFGDYSLILKNPTKRDTGTYSCTVYKYGSGKILTMKHVLLDVKAGPDSLIIAIDFGSGFSGYAFNVKPRKEGGETQIKRWSNGLGLDTPKTPTCILFDEHQQFVSFGYKAKQTYLKTSGKDGRAMFFFDCFKMSLYGKRVSTDLTIKAANRREMKALKVFTEALRFLKDDALKTIQQNTEGKKFTASDFTWVLTVPAIWDHSAKQFMREAATQAGIVSEGTKHNLVFALEPEAASVHCKKLPLEGFIAENRGESKLDQSPGTRYIVVDCGGGSYPLSSAPLP
ncbi:heat shock 70 kDa protein 12A-like, partial [Xiphophorus maculatus]|uniref:heat shock 70 kDa protein 12A-like n=1 Tax=Xiphophorus maculatus TaxID=8083 RepID=UPI000C6E5D2A